MDKQFDAIVIGAGHAGAEAASALARLNNKTLLVSVSLDAIAFMACNPNIGGTAKGHLVKEIDALGGIMGEMADKATIQTRMLNLGSGPAVHSLRAQVDKNLYHRLVKARLERTENLYILQSEAASLMIENGVFKGMTTAMGDTYTARVCILATGVYLNAKVITGEYSRFSGPNGLMRSEKLTDSLLSYGLPIRRFKTGTPARASGKSIDYSKMEIQNGDIGIPKFSMMTEGEIRNDAKCYLTYTNGETHKIILDNLSRAPLYNGSIHGTGPRYCPSIEDKIVRFKDKERHQVFIEPEGADTDEVYIQGMSTSLPFDVQEKMLRTIKGLENVHVTRYGYAIEYDCLDPLALTPALSIKGFTGLYSAGQINGSSGYEEAAAQGLIAGINAARFLNDLPPFILRRDQAYIGVLIDDLVTKGTNEPYRMMTSRAEHRLYLRQDNADVRLTPMGREIGLVDDARYAVFTKRMQEIERLKILIEKAYPPTEAEALCERKGETKPKSGISVKELLKRSNISASDIIGEFDAFRDAGKEELEYIETELKYEGYIGKQQQAIKEAARLEEKALSPDIDYSKIDGLRIEARQKLNKIKPITLAQASRISGVTPADITVLMLYLIKAKK